MNYIRVNLDWMLDVSPEAAVFYGICMKSYKQKGNNYKRIDRNTGEMYQRMATNYFLTMYKGNITKYKIGAYIKELEDAGYIDVLSVRRPNKQVRFIKCNVNDDEGDSIYLPGDYMDASIYANLGVGIYVKMMSRKAIKKGCSFEDYLDYFDDNDRLKIIEELITNDLMYEEDGELESTEMLDDIVEEYFDYWDKHRRV